MLNNKFILYFSVVVLTLLSFSVISKERNVVVKLTHIEAVKTTERSGDELYFSISQYSNKETPHLFRIPMYPLHWLSKELPALKNVKLWEGKIADNQSILLVVSLLGLDLEPFNGDDHIGSVQVKLANKQGKVISKWGQPKFVDQPEVQQPNLKIPSYIMLGDGGKYKVVFKVEVR